MEGLERQLLEKELQEKEAAGLDATATKLRLKELATEDALKRARQMDASSRAAG